ncbi:ribonuclease domain-containing protein [Corynebacterium sp. 335C]
MTQNRWKGAAGAAGAVVLALAGAWFGLDLGDGGSGGSGSGVTTSPAAAADSGSGGDSGQGRGGAGNGGDGDVDPEWTRGTCAADTLPEEADDVIGDILQDRPLAHPEHDGKRFGNYEGILPKEKSGYYREYTVETPGLNHRGARRIVVGGGSEHDPDYWYWTDDHYESFCAIPDAEE